MSSAVLILLLIVLIGAFLAVGEQLDDLRRLLDEIRQELMTIQRRLTKDEQRGGGWWSASDSEFEPNPTESNEPASAKPAPAPQLTPFLRVMRSSGCHLGRLLRRVRTKQR